MAEGPKVPLHLGNTTKMAALRIYCKAFQKCVCFFVVFFFLFFFVFYFVLLWNQKDRFSTELGM